MKLFIIFMLAATLNASASLNGQTVTFSKKNVKLAEMFAEIKKQTGYNFLYNDALLRRSHRVDISVENMPVNKVLDLALDRQSLSYSMVDKTIVIKEDQHVKPVIITVKGTVTDAEGKPVAGVSIIVQGKTIGTTADDGGRFSIDVDETAVLEISAVGYLPQTIKVNKRTSINIVLAKNEDKLAEVVVVGYGQQARQKVTSAVTTLKTDQFQDAPYTDIQSAIAGRAAGVVVNFSGGQPGSVPSLTIRGGEPLLGQSSPLYVIDGIVRDGNAFANLNTNDIASISFLKDAAATAVFGSKAGAGIVMVTTKSGYKGRPVVTYSNNMAWNTPSDFPKLISAYDRALVTNAIGESAGYGKYSAYTQGQLDTIKNNWNPDKYPNTDWYKLTFRKYAFQQSHNLSLSGGSDRTKYYVGLGYFDQGSNYVNNSLSIKRFSYNSKVSSDFDEIGLNMTFTLNGYVNASTQPPAGTWAIFSHIVAKSPFDPAYNKDGSLSGLVDHPLAEIYSPGYSRGQTFFNDGNIAFTWKVPHVKGLSFRALGDYTITSNPSKTFTAMAPQYNSDGSLYVTPAPSLSESSSTTKAFDAEFQADYARVFGKHNIALTYVSVVRGGNNKWFSASRKNFPSTAVDQMFAGDASTQTNDGSASEWGEVGYVGRVKYDYAGKYLLELNGRYDGSDYFPKGKRFGFFPSVSAGWVISSEKFYEDAGLKNVFSFLKFKASYGEVGSIGGTKYAYVPQYGVNTQVYVANGNLQNGYYEGGLTIANQNITWYAIKSRDFGLEFETLNKKITGGLDYFFTKTKNILGSPAFRYTEPLGQSLPQVLTDATTRKEGFDASINYNWGIGKELNGYIGFNCTYFNYLWERTNEDSATLTNPFTRSWGINQDYYSAMYSSLGLYQNYADILNNPTRLTSNALGLGDVWLEDTNGDGKIDGQDFRRLGKAQSPHFTFGVPFGLQFKGIRLDALVQGAGNRNVILGSYLQGGEGAGRINFDFQKDFWLPGNTNASFPRAGNSAMNSSNNYTGSTFWLKNARFVRLKSLTLSYDLKRVLTTHIFSSLSLHVAGTNLITLSPVTKYFDPELADNNNFFYPVNRTYSVGIRAGF